MELREVFLTFLFGTLILLVFAFSLIAFLIHYKRKQQRHRAEKMTLAHQYQTQLLQTRLEVQEQSFKHFSEEIHDNVGQILTLCKLQLRQLETRCKDESLQELITNSTDLLGKALTDLRSISHTLNGNFVNRLGLKEALEKELKYISSGKQITTELSVAGDIIQMDKEKELLVFRIAQEAITNTLKHAAPSLISVALIYEPSAFTIKVIDNGAGFEAGAVQSNLGLSNMQTRARLLDGNIIIDSVKEKGTTITLQIPLPYGKAVDTHSHSR